MRAQTLIPQAPPTGDLIDIRRVGDLDMRDVTAVAKATLDVGKSMLESWTELEPVVRQLTALLRSHVEMAEGKWRDDPRAVSGLLSATANVVEKTAKAAQAVLRSSEGQARLAVFMAGGVTKRPGAGDLTEKQLAGVVIEAAKRMRAETGTCPVCDAKPTIDATATMDGVETVQ